MNYEKLFKALVDLAATGVEAEIELNKKDYVLLRQYADSNSTLIKTPDVTDSGLSTFSGMTVKAKDWV